MSTVLTLNSLSYKRNQQQILHDVNLTLNSGRIVGLLGENGAGKTTLMRLIIGNAKGHGEVIVNGAQAVVQRKQAVSFSDRLSGLATNEKTAHIAKTYQQLYPDFDPDRYQELATFLKIDGGQRLGTLSKGTREKLVIALTLSRNAALYLLDEPFSGIDSMSRKKIIKSILKWLPAEATLVVSDHYVTEIAPILDEIVVIKDQTVAVHRATDEIREQLGLEIEDYYESLYEEGTEDDV